MAMLSNEDIHSITHRFQPARLTLARELRCMRKSELAEKVGKTASAVSQFELGKTRPDAETILRLALALAVPPTFFAHKSPGTAHIGVEECHFRSLRSASQRDRRQLLAIGSFLSDLITELENFVSFPGVHIPECPRPPESNSDIEVCAESARKSWGLGFGPMADMIGLVEHAGIVVCPLLTDSEKVDAFSYWHNNRPYIFLLLNKDSASRSRFDVAHELGHLVMHADVSPGNPRYEQQANRFASAFLLPRESFYAECPTRLNWGHFLELKKRWGVSLAALVRRAHDLGRLSEASYRRACIQLAAMRCRQAEPEEPRREWPTLILKAVELTQADQPIDSIAFKAGIPEGDVLQILRLLRDESN